MVVEKKIELKKVFNPPEHTLTNCCFQNFYTEINKRVIQCVNCGNRVSYYRLDNYESVHTPINYGRTKSGNLTLDWYDKFYDGYGYYDTARYKEDHN